MTPSQRKDKTSPVKRAKQGEALPPPVGDLAQQTIFLSIEFRGIGTHRKVDQQAVLNNETGADPERLHVSKEILDSDELRGIWEVDREIKTYLRSRALSTKVFRHGVYLLPLALLEEVDARLEIFRTERGVQVERFLEMYPQQVQEARQALGQLWDEKEYPSPAQIRAAFDICTFYLTLSAPTTLKAISRALYEREQQRVAQQLEGAADEVRGALRVAMAELVAYMTARLADTPEGKPQRFRASAVGKVRDFLDTFAARNVVGDQELAVLVEKAKGIVAGVDTETLRKSPEVRAQVRQGFAALQQAIAPLVELAGTRKISFEEEP